MNLLIATAYAQYDREEWSVTPEWGNHSFAAGLCLISNDMVNHFNWPNCNETWFLKEGDAFGDRSRFYLRLGQWHVQHRTLNTGNTSRTVQTGQWQKDHPTNKLTLRLDILKRQPRHIPTTVWTIVEPDWSQLVKNNHLFLNLNVFPLTS